MLAVFCHSHHDGRPLAPTYCLLNQISNGRGYLLTMSSLSTQREATIRIFFLFCVPWFFKKQDWFSHWELFTQSLFTSSYVSEWNLICTSAAVVQVPFEDFGNSSIQVSARLLFFSFEITVWTSPVEKRSVWKPMCFQNIWCLEWSMGRWGGSLLAHIVFKKYTLQLHPFLGSCELYYHLCFS